MSNLLQRFYTFLRPFLEPGTTPLLFIIGVILLNLVSNAVYDYLVDYLGQPVTIILMGFGLLALFAAAYDCSNDSSGRNCKFEKFPHAEV